MFGFIEVIFSDSEIERIIPSRHFVEILDFGGCRQKEVYVECWKGGDEVNGVDFVG